MCVCVFTCIYYSCWSMACLELRPYEWSQGAVVICVCVSVCVLTLCHSLTGRSVKSVGTCLFLVGLEGVGGERGRCVCVYICMRVFVWAPVGEITHQPGSLETLSRKKPFTDSPLSPLPGDLTPSPDHLKSINPPIQSPKRANFLFRWTSQGWSDEKKNSAPRPLSPPQISPLLFFFFFYSRVCWSCSRPGLSPCLTLSKTDKQG